MSKANTLDLQRLRIEKNDEKVLAEAAATVEELITKYAKFIPEDEILARVELVDSLYFYPPVYYEQQIRVDGNIVAKIQLSRNPETMMSEIEVIEGV